MSLKTSFVYRDFYDVPRMIVFHHKGSLILLDSPFDTDADEYSDTYGVFVLPNMSPDALQGSWENLSSAATKFVGQILVRDVKFDPTMRKEIDTDLIDDLLRGVSSPEST